MGVIRAYLAAAAIAAALSGLWWFGKVRFESGAESVRSELREASITAAETARIQSRERAASAERIDTDVLSKKRAAAAMFAAGHVDGDGLRLALADRSQPAAGTDASICGAERSRAELLAGLLGESSRLVEESSGIVGEAVTLIDGLQQRASVK